jgi:hypothetical protein
MISIEDRVSGSGAGVSLVKRTGRQKMTENTMFVRVYKMLNVEMDKSEMVKEMEISTDEAHGELF